MGDIDIYTHLAGNLGQDDLLQTVIKPGMIFEMMIPKLGPFLATYKNALYGDL